MGRHPIEQIAHAAGRLGQDQIRVTTRLMRRQHLRQRLLRTTPQRPLALRFVASRPFVTSVLVGATSLAQLKENHAAFAAPLSSEAQAAIDAIHAAHPNP